MSRDVYLFLLRGVVTFLFLELLSLPFRGAIVSFLQGLLPPGFKAVWECTGLDEVFLFISFVLAYPSRKPKLPAIVTGVLLIELFNAARIWAVIQTGDLLLHDVLFRWGGFLVVMVLFYLSFRWLRDKSIT